MQTLTGLKKKLLEAETLMKKIQDDKLMYQKKLEDTKKKIEETQIAYNDVIEDKKKTAAE